MSKNLIKDTLRTIKQTLAKFITLFAIVALGVAFFVGISAAAPIMSKSVDRYNDDNSFMDLQIYSTFGFEDADIKVLANIEGVEQAVGNKFVDVIGKYNDTEYVIRFESYKENQTINNFVLKEGRLPQNENEVLAELGSEMFNFFPLDAVINISRPNDDVDDSLAVTQVKVVGLIDTPDYLNEKRSNSTLNNRTISTYMFVPESTFTTDFYTSLLITVEGAKELNGFSKEYIEHVQQVEDRVDTVAITQSQARRNRIYNEAMEDYTDGLHEYEDGKKEFNDEIAKAERKIRDAQQELIDGEKEIKENEQKLETETTQALHDLDAAQYELEKGLVEWKKEKKKFDEETKPALVAQKEALQLQLNPLLSAKEYVDSLNQSLQDVNNEISSLKEMINNLPDGEEKIKLEEELVREETKLNVLETSKTDLLNNLNMDEETFFSTITTLSGAIHQIDVGITKGEEQLNSAKYQLDDGSAKVWAGRVELEETKIDAENQLADAKTDLAKGKRQLAEAKQELHEEKEKGQKELDDGWADLVKAKEDIDTIEKAEWTILNRDMNYSSKTFKDTIGQMESIAAVFPVFFFLVAALVCLTTMTRMVDEQRGQIGVLRALGYGKLACASKYLVYAILATILGGIVGSVLGLLIFPSVIYNAWKMMYILPEIQLVIPWNLIVISNGLFITVMGCTTWFACRQSMNEVPSQLLRPKSPPMGKKIILERISFIWNRFSFTSKVTARNIIRYKKRFFMTVIGIAGCTALLVAGFGIKDSISSIISNQFEEIYKYDGQLIVEDDLVQSKINQVESKIIAMDEVSDTTQLFTYQASVKANDKDEVSTVYVYQNDAEAKRMNNIKHRINNDVITLKEGSVIINEKLAELLNIGVGDMIQIESNNEIIKNFVVGDICEMYVNHSIFMTPETYEKAFNIKPSINSIQLVFESTDFNETIQKIIEIDGVESVEFYQSLIENFNSMINGLNIVVIVLLICAGLLAFVVLSNLTNVNISERQREIATLKVLGFNRKEVNMYIYKENLFLTFIGSLVGLGLGMILHRFIILMVEMDYIMFGRDVSLLSLVLSVLITMFFAVVVNLFMTSKLKKIQMVESLKSVE